jgi:hypothetical protein
MFRIIIVTVVIAIGLFILDSALVFAQQEVIGDGQILNSLWSWKNMPIQEFQDTLFTVLVDGGLIYLYIGIPSNGWGIIQEIPAWPPYYLEFLNYDAGRYGMGRSFFYNSQADSLFFWEPDPYGYWIFKGCPGRPVMDSDNDIHVIWEDASGDYIYGFSADTLNSFTAIDTLSNFPRFIRLTLSPDKEKVAAIFYDFQTDSVYKYLESSGEPIDFSFPDGVFGGEFSFGGDLAPAYDMALDDDGSLYYILNREDGFGWGEDHIWSEQNGYRFLCNGDDVAMMQITYEILFSQSEGEMIVIRSENFLYSNLSTFYVSLDGGDTWYTSSFQIPGASGTALRRYSDHLDFVYNDGEYSYYYPIPRDSIFSDLTSNLEGDRIIPGSFSLSNYPNPFNTRTSIEFQLPESGPAEISIYDITGKSVIALVDDYLGAGNHTIVWDGRNSAGQPVSSGVYFYRISVGDHTATRRMLLLK